MKTWKFIAIILFVAFAILIAVAIAYARNSPLRVDVEEARRDISKGKINVVLDVRTDPEWALGHYEGAIHIPAGKIATLAPQLISKDARILVYCNTGQRSRAAAEQLRDLGFPNVRYITSSHLSLA